MRSEDRRVLPHGDWAAVASFQWNIPADFSIARAICDDWAEADPERTAIVDLAGGARTVWTFGHLKDVSDRVAAFLKARGVEKGDRVAILLPQCAEVIVAHVAAMKLGAIVLPLFTLFGPDALAFRLADAQPKAVVTDSENIDRLLPVLPDGVRTVLVTGEGVAQTGEAAHALSADKVGPDIRIAAWREALSVAPLGAPEPLGADDPAVLIYTSGTTGPPKGALHAHRFLIGHLPCVELSLDGFPQTGDVGWTPADWAWIGGLMDLAMPCLNAGVPLVAHRFAKFDAEAAWRLMVDEGVSVSFLPPTALKLLRQVPVPEGHRLRGISSGGESLAPDLVGWVETALGARVNELYGQTECNLVVASSQRHGMWRAGAVGQAVPGHDVAIIGPDGAPLPDAETGEIAVRRPDPVMFLGYWNQPEKTAEKFVGDWLRTGDLGQRDADGFISFVARDDDIISSAGYRIGPTEIENCLTGDEDVLLAAAIGVPDALKGEVVKAFVVLREGAAQDGLEERLIARVRERISPHVAPRSVRIVDALPMTATGKVQRKALREKHSE